MDGRQEIQQFTVNASREATRPTPSRRIFAGGSLRFAALADAARRNGTWRVPSSLNFSNNATGLLLVAFMTCPLSRMFAAGANEYSRRGKTDRAKANARPGTRPRGCFAG